MSVITNNNQNTICNNQNNQNSSRFKQKPPRAKDLHDYPYNDDALKFIFHNSFRLTQEYGGVTALGPKQFLITDPIACKHILKTNVNNYSKDNFTYNRIRLIFGYGLICNEGAIWEHHRSILEPAFTREKLGIYANIMTEAATELLYQFKENQTTKIDLIQEISTLTLKIAFRSFCSHHPSKKELATIHKMLTLGNEHISYALCPKPWFLSYQNIRFFWARKKTHQMLKKIIKNRRDAISGKEKEPPADFLQKDLQKDLPKDLQTDFLQLLLNATHKNYGLPLTDNEILDELLTILLTGYETIALGLIWTFILLAENPQYVQKMRHEIATVLQAKRPMMDDLSRLPITKAVFLEALRLYPPIWILPRIAKEDDVVSGFNIPKKSNLMLNIHALHRNPWYWTDPHVFSPERFLVQTDEARHPFAYLPFSVGAHSCIGSHFALLEGVLVLACLIPKVDLTFLKKPKKEIIARPLLSLRPPKRVFMKVTGVL